VSFPSPIVSLASATCSRTVSDNYTPPDGGVARSRGAHVRNLGASGCSTGNGSPSRWHLAQTRDTKSHRYPSRSPCRLWDSAALCRASQTIVLDGKPMSIHACKSRPFPELDGTRFRTLVGNSASAGAAHQFCPLCPVIPVILKALHQSEAAPIVLRLLSRKIRSSKVLTYIIVRVRDKHRISP